MVPPSVTKATTNFDANVKYSHEGNLTVNATCLDDHEWDMGKTVQTINCTEDGWDMASIKPGYKGNFKLRLVVKFKSM